MSTLLEKLNKEELLDGLAKESPIDAVEILLNLGKDIPENIIDMVTKGPDDFYARLKSGTSYRLKDAFRWIIYDNIKKVSDNTINTIANNSDFDDQFIYDLAHSLLHYKNKIPDIILKRLSNNPNYSYSIAYALTHKEKEIPEILWPAISKLPPESPVSYPASLERMKNSYIFAERLRLKGIEIPVGLKKALDGFLKVLNNKNVKIPDDLRKEMENYKAKHESAVVEEKLDKNELLNVAASDFDGSFNLVNAVIDVDNPDKESIKQVLDNENVLKSFIDLERTLELIAKFSENDPTMAVRARVWYAIVLILHNRKVPDALYQKIAKDETETRHYYNYLKKHGLEIPDVILKSYENNKRMETELQDRLARRRRQRIGDIMNESSDKQIISEKLNKEELVNAIADAEDPEEIYDFIHSSIKNKTVIPEIILNEYLKNSRLFTLKQDDEDYNTQTINVWVKIWSIYAENLIEKNIEIPKIVLEAISKSPQYSRELIDDFLHKKKNIPKILIKSVSLSSEHSHWIARRFIERNKKVPEILYQSITKEPMLLQTYKQFLKEIEIEKKVKEAYASKEEVKESVVVNEKLDKEDLLKAAANDPFESFALAKKYVEKYKEPPEELVRGLTQRKKEEWTGSNYNHSVAYAMLAIDHDVKVPDYVLESILESEYDAYDYLVKMIKDKRIISDNFLNTYFEKYYNPPEALEQKPIFGEDYTYSKDVEMWSKYTEFLLHENLEIPENVIYAVSKSIYYSERTIEHLLYKKRDVPDILVKAVSLSPRYSYYSAVHFIEYEKEVPEILNQSIAKDPAILDMYNEFLPKSLKFLSGKEEVNESFVINEKLDKEELVSAFLKDANVTYKYVQKNFLNKNQEPPEEFINAMAQSAYVSENYFKDIVKRKMNVPDVIKKGILKDSQSTLKTWQEFGEFMPMRDIVNSISQSHYKSMEFYKIQKEKNKKVPPIILKSIISNEYASYDLAKIFLEENKPVPDVIIRGFISMPQSIFTFAMEVLKKGFDLPKIILRTIADNYDNYMGLSGYADFDMILFSHLKQNKKIPDILLDAFDKKEDHDIARFCMKLGRHHIKIPDRILDTLIEKTPKHGVTRYLGAVSYDILSYYLIKSPESVANPEEVLKTLPTRLYQYAIGPDMAGIIHTKKLIKGFLTVFGKVPEDFKQTIINEYEKYGNTIPKEIADAVGIKQPKAINEKLEKDELLDAVIKDASSSYNLILKSVRDKREFPEVLYKGLALDPSLAEWETRRLMDDKKDIPDILIKSISTKTFTSKEFAKHFLNTYDKQPPEIIINSIARRSEYSLYYARNLMYTNEDIPEVISKGIARDPFTSSLYADELKKAGREVPDIILKTYPDISARLHHQEYDEKKYKTIEEKLDKNELLSSLLNPEDYDESIDSSNWSLIREIQWNEISDLGLRLIKSKGNLDKHIIDNFFAKSSTNSYYFIELLIKQLNARLYSDKNALNNIKNFLKNIPEDIVKKIAYTPSYSYHVADNLIFHNIKVPDLLLITISKYPQFSSKLNNLYDIRGEEVPEIIAKSIVKESFDSKTITEKLDKNELLDAVIKDKYQVNQMVFNFAANDKKIPEKLVEYISQNWNPSYMYQIAIDIIRYSNYDVPEMILRGIAKSNSLSNEMAGLYKNHYLEIPDVIMNALTPKQKEFYNSVWFSTKKPITEKLDKGELLNVISSDDLSSYSLITHFIHMEDEDKDLIINFLKNIAEAENKIGIRWSEENAYLLVDAMLWWNINVPNTLLKIVSKSPKHSSDLIRRWGEKVPEIIANAIAKKSIDPETITEKLDKSELLKVISKDAEGSSIVFQHLWNDSNKRKNIPKEVLRGVSKDPIASYAYARSLSWKDVPLIIVKGIAKDSATSLRYAQDLVHRRIKIPNLIARSIYNNNLFAKRFDYFLFDIKQDKNVRPDKNDKEYFDNLFDGVINEKLDKSELLGVIQKDYDGYIQIMDFFFRKKNEYPPEEFLKMATETDEASRIFAEYCLEMKKDIPDEVIKKVAETPRSAYTIAALMILEERKVPEILIKSINSDPLSKKHFEQFAKNQKYPIHIPTLYYAKI
jgi:hypothetical protein